MINFYLIFLLYIKKGKEKTNEKKNNHNILLLTFITSPMITKTEEREDIDAIEQENEINEIEEKETKEEKKKQ